MFSDATRRTQGLSCLVALAACGGAGFATAAEPLSLSGQMEVAVLKPMEVPALAAAPRSPFDGAAIASRSLAERRGGSGVVNQNRLNGVVANNSASQLTTGTNLISEGAFAGSSGLPTVIQNSGNNVLIQNSTIVNVQIK